MIINRRFKRLVKADASIIGLVMLLGSGLNTVQAADSILASQHYETALMKYYQGDLKSAVIELKNTLQAEPGHLAALTMLVKTYMETENYLSAEATMLMAEKSGADPSLLVLHKAEIYINQLRYKQLLTDIVPEKFKPGLAAEIHLYRGFANLQLEELGTALNEYQIAARLEPMKIEPLLGQIKVLLQLGNVDSAKNIAQKATEIESSSVDLWVIKAAIEKTQGNLEQALQFYNQVLLKQPEHFDELLERAGILIELQKDLLAEKDLVLVRQLSETNLKAAYLYSLVLARNDRQDESKKVLLDAVAMIDQLDLDIIRQYSQVVLLAGLINFNVGNYDRALEFLQIYRNRHPNELDSYRMIGAIYLNRGEHEQVIDLIKPVVSLKTRDHKILYILAKAYMHNGQNDMAEMILNRLVDLNIKRIDIYTLIGQNKLAMGQHEEAIKAFSNALRINSANNDAGVPLSLLLVNLERYTEAIKVVAGLLENDPENLMLLNLLGTTQLKAGFSQQARESFNRCIKIDEKYTTAHLNLIKLDITQNKFQEAEARLQGLVEKYPENLEFLLELSRFYRRRTQNDLALRYLDRAKKVSPDNMDLKIAQIEMNLRLGLPSKALVLAQDLYAQNRENLQVMEILARCFLATKNIGKAKGMIQKMSVVAGFNSKQLHQISRLQLKINDASGAIKSLKKSGTRQRKLLSSPNKLV